MNSFKPLLLSSSSSSSPGVWLDRSCIPARLPVVDLLHVCTWVWHTNQNNVSSLGPREKYVFPPIRLALGVLTSFVERVRANDYPKLPGAPDRGPGAPLAIKTIEGDLKLTKKVAKKNWRFEDS